ncbi:hypothetical protein ERJ70_18670 [Sediminibacillus dalangtanensis]|uniref:MucB/RseB N-terminal domain-containing protein n=1 Tax=Sediminibacillus dalangtanensis TaxID=2729421 RepID=A0ABX7VZD4_9BACI|nr:hypothetical protein [Sediminibacillus dalangtanensis]QTN01131.1 hypothetical protein ERJ70_18670 [Sediminibacillus dalangtanensis]
MDEEFFQLLKQRIDNSSELKKVEFTKKSKEQVLDKLHRTNNEKRYKKRHWRGPMNFVLTAILLLGISYIGYSAIKDNGQFNSSSEDNPSIGESDHSFEESTNEEKNNLTKKAIKNLMLNSDENFMTAQGEFNYHLENIDLNEEVNYKLSMEDPFGGYATSNSINGDEESRYYYSEDYIWEVDESEGTYFKAENQDREPKLKPVTQSLFPTHMARDYLASMDLWSIEEQNGELVGRKIFVIAGELSDYGKELNSADSFRFWVDKETGILIQYEIYSSSGEVKDSLYTESLEIDEGLEEFDYKPDLTGYRSLN